MNGPKIRITFEGIPVDLVDVDRVVMSGHNRKYRVVDGVTTRISSRPRVVGADDHCFETAEFEIDVAPEAFMELATLIGITPPKPAGT